MAYPQTFSTPNYSYLSSQVMSASPSQLVVMLYDGLIRFLTSAQDGFSIPDVGQRIEVVHNNLIRAQSILTELNADLDLEQGGQVAQQLSDLYQYFISSLRHINISKNPSDLSHIIQMIGELRDAWVQVANPLNAGSASGVASSQAMV